MNSLGVGKDTVRDLKEIDVSKIQVSGMQRSRATRMDPLESTKGMLARFKTMEPMDKLN